MLAVVHFFWFLDWPTYPTFYDINDTGGVTVDSYQDFDCGTI